MNRLEEKMDRLAVRLDTRMDALDTKNTRQFTWMVGIQILMFIALMTALARLPYIWTIFPSVILTLICAMRGSWLPAVRFASYIF